MIRYIHSLTSLTRDDRKNLHLGMVLAFVAGAINAGGFLAVGRYTSHMTGILSSVADNLIVGQAFLAGTAALLVLMFLLGAIVTSWIMIFSTRRHWEALRAAPLLLEAVLLLVFGLLGAYLTDHQFLHLSITGLVLCFVMGLQNAYITKISHSEIRTTHMTGLITDIGIEMGRLLYWNRHTTVGMAHITADLKRLKTCFLILGSFCVGALLGALGFQFVGFTAVIPLAGVLCLLALGPIMRARQVLWVQKKRHAR